MKRTIVTTGAMASLLLASLTLTTQGATIVDEHYTTNTTLADNGLFLESADATWTIDPGVTVSGGRYFIGSNADPDTNPANFTIDGGGTLDITRNGIYNLRLGQNNDSEPGTLTIKGGSKLLMTGPTASAFMEEDGGWIKLEGVGSTFQWAGTWDDVNLKVQSQASSASHDIPLSVSGGNLQIQTSGGFTTATVVAVPEPSAVAFLGLGGLALILRRRK